MKRVISILLVCVMLAGCMFMLGCSEKKSSAVIGIGGIGPLTGSTAKYGLSVKQGAEVAVEEINALGGLQFELNFKDDVNDEAKAQKAYGELKDWGMQVLLGATTTEPCVTIADKADEDRVFTVTPSASASEITEGHDNVFRVCYNDKGQGKVTANYIAANALSQGIAIIYKKGDAYSEGVYKAFKAECDRLELKVVSVTTFDSDGEKDFSSQIADAKEAGADLLFLPIYYEPAARIIAQADEMNFYPLIFGTDGIDGILTVEGFDKTLAEGVHLLTSVPSDYKNDRTRHFMESYQEKYGEMATQFAADAYDAVYAIYEAAKKAEVTADMSAEEMCDLLSKAMTEIELDGVTSRGSKLTWDSTGEVKKDPIVVVIQNGNHVIK